MARPANELLRNSAPALANRASGVISVGGQSTIVAGFSRLADELPAALRPIEKALINRAIPDSWLLKTNRRLATEAQAQIVAGWRSRLPRRSRRYRKGDRQTGALGPALASPAMTARTTPSTISFVNGPHLSNTANHWWRVNYGAYGPNLAMSRFEEEGFAVRGLERGATLRDRSKPAPQSWLPQAFQWDRFNRFWPTQGPADVRGRGVRAARFTDLGAEHVADRLVPYYQQTLVQYASTEAGRAKFHRLNITVPVDPRAMR